MHFSPAAIPTLIIEPLRYFFGTYTGKSDLIWHQDEKKRTLEVGHSFDFNKVALEERPRVLVERGNFTINKVGITDNMAEGDSHKVTQGANVRRNMLLYEGTANIIVEAKNKGVCEMVADMTSHFIAWTRPLLCDTQGFKEFGLPMNVGPCTLTEPENIEKFQVQIQVPWIREEHWIVREDGIMLKNLLANIHPG